MLMDWKAPNSDSSQKKRRSLPVKWEKRELANFPVMDRLQPRGKPFIVGGTLGGKLQLIFCSFRLPIY